MTAGIEMVDCVIGLCAWPSGCPDRAATRDYCDRHYKKLWYVGRLPSTLTDAAPVQDRIQLHVDRGRTYWSLSTTTGIDHKVIKNIHLGHTKQVRTNTARKILAAPLKATPLGCLRRIQALARLGHTRAHIAATAGCSPACIKTILYQRRPGAMSGPIADRISTAYNQLSTTPGANRWVTTLAERNGYLPPWCWDGLDIDDPTTEPHQVLHGPRLGSRPIMSAAYVAARTGIALTEVERCWQARGLVA